MLCVWAEPAGRSTRGQGQRDVLRVGRGESPCLTWWAGHVGGSKWRAGRGAGLTWGAGREGHFFPGRRGAWGGLT